MIKKAVKIVGFNKLDDDTEELVVNLSPAHKVPAVETKEVSKIDKKKQLQEEIIAKFGQVSAATNAADTKQKFEGRNNYKKVINDFQEHAIDIWYDMPLYGKINDSGAISSIPRDNDTAPLFIVYAMTDIINSFRNRFISRQSKFLRDLKIKSRWQDADAFYTEEIEGVYTNFYQEYLDKLRTNKAIKNIDDFYDLLLEHVENSGDVITRAGFLESNNYNPLATGLVYDFHTGDPQSDVEKLSFIEDPNYEAFVYLAKEHGFKVDPNVPWRLVADVRSDKMWPYLAKYHLKGFDDKPFASADLKKVFKEVFKPHANYKSFLGDFAANVTAMYNQFIEDNPTYQTLHLTHLKATRKTKIQVLPRKEYKGFNPAKWVVWYAKIRNAERGSPLPKRKLKMLIKNLKQIIKHAAIKLEEGNNEDYRKFSELAITHVEYSLGTIATTSKPIDRKDLTIVEKDPIILMNFS